MSINRDTLLVTEIFHSLQGETSLSGVRFGFIRLTGCNLRCSYCDTSYAFKGKKRLGICEIINRVRPFNVENILITGGEPLLQRPTPALVHALRSEGYRVSIETHGELPIEPVADLARIVIDIKTPSSGMCRGGFVKNLKYLKASDEIKFVIASQSDYLWARDTLRAHSLHKHCDEILMSPAVAAADSPGAFPGVQPHWLAAQILEDQLPVRLQLQLHKLIWGADSQGV